MPATTGRPLVMLLRAGDERAFETLVSAHHPTMLAVAETYVRTRAVAEEVVQEAWVGVLEGLDRFEGRSSLKTWILRIVANTARTRGVREARIEAFAGHWRRDPRGGERLPEDVLYDRETLQVLVSAIAALPPAQRIVIAMRDVEGCGPAEVCATLAISEGNQRVLLHRARSRVRAALEEHRDG